MAELASTRDKIMQNFTETQDVSELESQKCPKCNTTVPIYANYVTWCHNCNWNVRPYAYLAPKNMLEAMYLKLGQRLSKALFDELVKSESLQPRWTPPKIAAYAIAALVHLSTLLIAIGGLLLIVRGWPNPLFLFVGVVLLAVVYYVVPRWEKIKIKRQVDKDKFPTLHKIVQQISDSLGLPHVEIIMINEDFNAFVQQKGWRRKRLLTLGLPLFSILSPQEKIALLGHELGHYANGDANRTWFVGKAVQTLELWVDLLQPERQRNRMIVTGTRTSIGFVVIITRFLTMLLFGLFALLARAATSGLSHLLWRDKQRAEYLADYMAATVGGTEAALSGLQKLHYRATFELAVQKVIFSQGRQNLFEVLHRQLDQTPKREIERISRVERLANSRLDATHPPTPLRLDFLNAHPIEKPMVVIDEREAVLLEKELEILQRQIQEVIVDNQLSRLYRR